MLDLDTCGDLVAFCLRQAGVTGVGQTPIAEDFRDSMITLRSMIAQFQRRRWLVPTLQNVMITSTGALSYTIGTDTSDFPIGRPDKIDSAYGRFLNQTGPNTLDFPLGIIPSWEDYNTIALKNLGTIPTSVFYDSAFPIGNLYFWPLPPAGQYGLNIACKASLPIYNTLTTQLALPDEYAELLIYGLTVRLAGLYGLDPKPVHVQGFRSALATVRSANLQLPELGMPAAVAISGRRGNGSTAASGSAAFQSGQWG